VSFPDLTLTLSRLSASFIWLIPRLRDRQSRLSVLMHSSNHYPLGNCDSPKPETSLSYLTQSGAVSYRSSLPSSFFAFTDSARTLPEELVNPASSIVYVSTDFTGVVSTSLTRPFPGRPGVSLKLLRQAFTHRQSSQPASIPRWFAAAWFTSMSAASPAESRIDLLHGTPRRCCGMDEARDGPHHSLAR